MEVIKGSIAANKLEVDLIEGGDLLIHEGPILSHYTDINGHHYLLWWADSDNTYVRWFLVRVQDDEMVAFFNGITTLRDLFLENDLNYIHVLDVDNNTDVKKIYILQNNDIPLQLLPQEASYYAPKFYTKYAAELSVLFLGKFDQAVNEAINFGISVKIRDLKASIHDFEIKLNAAQHPRQKEIYKKELRDLYSFLKSRAV